MPKEAFVEFDVIRDTGGVVLAVLTYRTRANGEKCLSWSFMREFDDAGTLRRTCWLNSRHNDAVARLLPKVKERIAQEEAKMKAPVHRVAAR